MNLLKKENDPISYLYRQFSSLEFKEHKTIRSLITDYYPLNKDEEIFIKDISIKDKNEFINKIKKIFHELSISMETIEYIFNEYYQFINSSNNNENPFKDLQKSEVINKLGISSNMYKKIFFLFNEIITNLNNVKVSNSNNVVRFENNSDEEMRDENDKNNKKNIEEKIQNINNFSKEMNNFFTDYYKMKKDKEKEQNKENNEKTKKQNPIFGSINLSKEEEEKLKKSLEDYENQIM